ncbi:MAG TPA: precorrin 6A synthase [Friedmanniella sp.]
MSVRVLVVGIGSGDPAHLTGEAVAALNAVDVFLVADKRAATRDLVTLRAELCAAVITHDRYRFVEVADPERGPDASRDSGAYADAVRDWHAERARRYADTITAEVGASGTVGLLVWGDPSLYDSTLRVVDTVAELLRPGGRSAGDGNPSGFGSASDGNPSGFRSASDGNPSGGVGGCPPSGQGVGGCPPSGQGVDVEVTVVPGISSVSLLAARHRIALNRVGQPVHITTGRRLLAEYDPALGDVVVMLDGDLACAGLIERHPDLEIFWGAQLGLADEALVHGRLAAVLPEIRTRRDAVRAARGWVMDTYLLRPGTGS